MTLPEQNKPLRGLYAITPDGLAEEELLSRVDAALRGGVKILQYRDKSRSATQRAEIASALHALCRRHNALFIVNDDLSLALAVDADGVHLGGDDGDLAAARQALGPDKLLGASCYADFAMAQTARNAGADYLAFGAVFPSPTKPHAVRAPLSLFTRCQTELGVPSCAIGGITLGHAPALISAGADMLALITDLFETADITSRAAAYQQLFQEKPRV